MCGICGIHFQNTTRLVDESILNRMNEALRHRGPDDVGVWSNRHVAFGARRLSIQDVDHGHQPMVNEDKTWAVAFNGELYNVDTLRDTLQQKGYSFNTHCDTEVILRAYEAYGESAVDHFNGMFAIAVYNAREDSTLLVRDRLGIKPLYYTTTNGTLAFASELDALMRSRLVSGAISPAALDAYFQYLYVPAPDSIFADVHKVRPGEIIRWRKGTLTKTKYWQPNYTIDDSWTLDSAAERYLELLEDAVRLQTKSDVPLGAFLSGGLDSSSIVAMLSRVQSAPVKTFSIGFKDDEANELQYARAVAKHFNTDYTEAILQPDVVAMSQSLTQNFGEPFADSSAIPTWLVSQMARDQVTVALSGDGGDELFAGYAWLHNNLKVDQYRRVPALLRHCVGAGLSLFKDSPTIRKIHRFHHDAYRNNMESFRRRHQCFNAKNLSDLFNPDINKRIKESHCDRFGEHLEKSLSLSKENQMLYQDTVMYLPDDILTKVDRMSMAVSLETRVPLLDHRIVEFAATVPFHLKYAQGTSKRLVKHALRDFLPEAALTQRKRGFAIPIHRWFREDLNDYFQDTVMNSHSLCRDYLDMCEVKRYVDIHQSGVENYGHQLWTLLMFEHWLNYAKDIPGISLAL